PAGAPAAKDVVSPNPSGPPNPGRQTSSHSSSGDNCQAPSIWQNLALAAIVVAIWPILGALWLLISHYLRDGNTVCLAILALPALFVILPSLFLQVMWLGPIHSNRAQTGLGPFALVAAVALLLAELLFVAGTLWWYSASEPADHFLFVERFVGLINGYS